MIRSMFGRQSGFQGGIRLPVSERSEADARVRQLAFAPRLKLPLRQHKGAEAMAVVRAGDEVQRGQLLARAEEETAVPLHAPATGRVVRISEQPDSDGGTVRVIELAPLAGDTQEEIGKPSIQPERSSPTELLLAIRETGLVGLGGEAGPTHLRLARARERGAKVLVINGIEGEPGFHRVPAWLIGQDADVITGMRCLLRVLETDRAVLAVESPDGDRAARLLDGVADGPRPELRILKPRYPQGAAALLPRVLSGGGRDFSASDVAVFNLGTVAEIGRLLGNGRVMTDQLLTLAGDGLSRPGNYRVPLGTPIEFALAQAGAQAELDHVLLGGPMRGRSLAALDRPVTKATTGLMAVSADSAARIPDPMPCIRCGECVAACPVQLHPAELGLLARGGEIDAMVDDWHLQRCFECGCCSYVCPSHIPLVQMFRAAKLQHRRARQLANEGAVA